MTEYKLGDTGKCIHCGEAIQFGGEWWHHANGTPRHPAQPVGAITPTQPENAPTIPGLQAGVECLARKLQTANEWITDADRKCLALAAENAQLRAKCEEFIARITDLRAALESNQADAQAIKAELPELRNDIKELVGQRDEAMQELDAERKLIRMLVEGAGVEVSDTDAPGYLVSVLSSLYREQGWTLLRAEQREREWANKANEARRELADARAWILAACHENPKLMPPGWFPTDPAPIFRGIDLASSDGDVSWVTEIQDGKVISSGQLIENPAPAPAETVVWAGNNPFTGQQVLDLLNENERLRNSLDAVQVMEHGEPPKYPGLDTECEAINALDVAATETESETK